MTDTGRAHGKKKHVEELLGTAGGEVFNQKDWQIQPTK
jgi:hypothetical protein